MKKAKMVLTAMVILAVVAGASAFKAKNAYSSVIFTGTSSTTCTTPVTGHIVSSGLTQIYASTQSTTSGCALNYTDAVE